MTNKPRITVLVGSETGNATECAEDLVTAIQKKGFDSVAIDMDDYEPEQLPKEQMLLVVTSTYGNGDPPSNAEALHAALQSPELELGSLRFGVCALGDRTYPLFAQCGKDFDRFLEERGAMRVIARVDCDASEDYYESFDAFQEQCLEWLDGGGLDAGAQAVAVAASEGEADSDVKKPVVYDARLVECRRLTRSACADSTYHLSFRFEGETPAFEPGDSLGVVPGNDPEEVQRIQGWLDADGSSSVTLGGEALPLVDALSARCCLQTVSRELAAALEAHSDVAKELSSSPERLKDFRDANDVLDLLQTAPRASLTADALVAALRAQAPRLYSVASSRQLHPDELHFTISTFDRDRPGRTLRGVASSWLCERLEVGAQMPMTLSANPRFRVSTDGAPMIMIGPGTGVAPFRGFLQELEAAGERANEAKTWLFFGHRRCSEDFLYEEDFVRWEKAGVLTKLSLAWSRDQDEKYYVQDEMRAHAREVWDWIEGGARIYVCGDAANMAPDVRRALQNIATSTGGVQDAEAWLERLVDDGRFCEDVY